MVQKIFALTTVIIALSFNAYADHRAPGSREFTKLIEEYKVACILSPCQEPFETKSLYREGSKQPSILGRTQLRALQRVANAQSKIWADTILEGDYVADGNTVLEKVIGIYKRNKLVAYKISYAEAGWDISDCNYDFKNPSTLSECPEGMIRETSFVSIDFGNVVRNHDDIADFYKKRASQQ